MKVARTQPPPGVRPQPGLSTLLTIASLGLYLPFSFIPVDTESRDEPTSTFKPREFSLRIEREGYQTWRTNVVCGTQASVVVHHVLDKM